MVASRKSSHRASHTTPRHAWLAALGLFVVARREAGMAVEIACDEAVRLRKQVSGLGDDARAVVRGGAITLREQVEPIIAQVGAGIEARLAPILQQFGLSSPIDKRTARTTAARKRAKSSSARRPAASKTTKRPSARAKRSSAL